MSSSQKRIPGSDGFSSGPRRKIKTFKQHDGGHEYYTMDAVIGQVLPCSNY